MPATSAITVEDFVATAKERKVEIEIRNGNILTLSKTFPKASNAGFAVDAETDCGLIYEVPQSSAGSTWGTTSDGIGFLNAISSGCMIINRSGVNKNWLKKLAKVLG